MPLVDAGAEIDLCIVYQSPVNSNKAGALIWGGD